MKFTADSVRWLEHKLIQDQLIMDCPEGSKADLLAYIAGANDMAQYIIDVMQAEEKQ